MGRNVSFFLFLASLCLFVRVHVYAESNIQWLFFSNPKSEVNKTKPEKYSSSRFVTIDFRDKIS